MQTQTMNAICLRFQNTARSLGRDPLAHWRSTPCARSTTCSGAISRTSSTRLTLLRRAYEYDHHYGLTLLGKAVPPLRAADSRSKFMEGVPQPASP